MSGVTLEDMESYGDLERRLIPAPGWGDGNIWVQQLGIEDALDINEIVQGLVADGVFTVDDDVADIGQDKLRGAMDLWYQVIVRCACNEDGSPLFPDRVKGLMLLRRKRLETITSVGQATFNFIFETGETDDPNVELVGDSSPNDNTQSIALPQLVGTEP